MRILSASLVCVFILLSACNIKSKQEYGVFIGLSSGTSVRLDKYNTVVIEPSAFSKKQIKLLHDKNKKVYGYLNVGAIEEYRYYYDRFKELTLGVYENWEDESWVDVSSKRWQEFIVNELGKEYKDLGLDGFFIDNADVYYHYNSNEIFEGLCSIFKGLKTYKLAITVNGGDEFVSRCIREGNAAALFDAVNQEGVFTKIDFENKEYGEQNDIDKQYFFEYLSKVKAAGISVYLLEYAADKELSKKIDAYCEKNGFIWYNAKDLELR